MENLITCIIVNFRTKKLTQAAVSSWMREYPNVPIVLVDNASGDDSTDLCRKFGEQHDHIRTLLNDDNIGHGPAMHRAIGSVHTSYIFTLDSDCEILKGGFLEKMLERLKDAERGYAVGWRRWVDKQSGVPIEWRLDSPPKADKFIPYIHPHAALYDLAKYTTLPAFFHHGAPSLRNMRRAHQVGYKLIPFPVKDYVKHWEAGTRRMYDGRWNPRASERPKPWKENQRFPI